MINIFYYFAMQQKVSQRSATAAYASEQREAEASAKPKLCPLRYNFERGAAPQGGPDEASAAARHSSPTRLVENTYRVRA